MLGQSLMDVGSVIPVVVAVMIFLGAMATALNTINERNEVIDLAVAMAKIVDTITRENVITKKGFGEAVTLLEATEDVSFHVSITCENGRGTDGGDKPPEGVRKITRKYPVVYENELCFMEVSVWRGA